MASGLEAALRRSRSGRRVGERTLGYLSDAGYEPVVVGGRVDPTSIGGEGSVSGPGPHTGDDTDLRRGLLLADQQRRAMAGQDLSARGRDRLVSRAGSLGQPDPSVLAKDPALAAALRVYHKALLGRAQGAQLPAYYQSILQALQGE